MASGLCAIKKNGHGGGYVSGLSYRIAEDESVLFLVRIFGEPAFPDSLFLLKQFFDAPEEAAGDDTCHDTPYIVLYEQGGNTSSCSQQQEYPPEACAPIIFRLDDYGMEQSDDEEAECPYEYTFKI